MDPKEIAARIDAMHEGTFAGELGLVMVPAVVDYPRRELGFLAELPMSGDDDTDMAAIAAAYAGRQGCRPENTGPIRLLK